MSLTLPLLNWQQTNRRGKGGGKGKGGKSKKNDRDFYKALLNALFTCLDNINSKPKSRDPFKFL